MEYKDIKNKICEILCKINQKQNDHVSIEKLILIHEILLSKNINARPLIKIPEGFKILKAVGDGTCFYHSIVQSGKELKSKELSKFATGDDLRNYIVKELEELLENPSNLFTNTNMTNISSVLKNSKNIAFKKAIQDIYQGICNEEICNEKEVEYEHIPNITNVHLKIYIKKIINNIRKKRWGGGPICHLISLLLNLCINVYNVNSGKFDLTQPDGVDCNENNTIYIYFDGHGHYDALVKNNIQK